MINCEKCNKGTLELIDILGAIETWRCDQCGYEENALVHYLVHPDPSVCLPTVYRVVGYWLSKPDRKIIIRAQEAFPELKAFSKIELYRKTPMCESFELGYFTEENISKQQSLLDSLGIKIELISLE